MKNKKKAFIIGGISLAVVVAIILCITLIPHKSEPAETETEAQTETTSDVSVDKPDETTSDTAEETIKTEEITDDGTGLQPIIEETTAQKTSTKKSTDTAKAETEATPAANEETGGITIGGGSTENYSCGCANHHCDGPETHAYIQNLELEGCPYCGSHSCASFYATDEWGHTCYNPSKCPSYDIKKDPCYYCQTCGKKCGDGSNGTCVQFVNACECPNCGKYVDSWTCHTCN